MAAKQLGCVKRGPIIYFMPRSTVRRKLAQYIQFCKISVSISYYGVEAANGWRFFLWGPSENAQALSNTGAWTSGQEMAFSDPASTE